MLWLKGEIILVKFFFYRLIMWLLRILKSLRNIFWTFIKLFMLSLFLMIRIYIYIYNMEDFIGTYVPNLVSS